MVFSLTTRQQHVVATTPGQLRCSALPGCWWLPERHAGSGPFQAHFSYWMPRGNHSGWPTTGTEPVRQTGDPGGATTVTEAPVAGRVTK